jgi:hypothetical protein
MITSPVSARTAGSLPEVTTQLPSMKTWNGVTDPSGTFNRAASISGGEDENAHGAENSPRK